MVFLYCSFWSCMSLYGAPEDGRWGEGRVLKSRNNPKGGRSAHCLDGERSCWQLTQTSAEVWTWLKTSQLLKDWQASLWFHPLRFQKCHRHDCWEGPQTSSGSKSPAPMQSSASSLLLAVSEHLLPLQDHLVEFLQAGLEALTIQRRAALCVVQRGQAQFMEGQHLLHLKHKGTRQDVTNHCRTNLSMIPTVNCWLELFSIT